MYSITKTGAHLALSNSPTAWRAVAICWAWTVLLMAGALIMGVSEGQSPPSTPWTSPVLSTSFNLLMGALIAFVWYSVKATALNNELFFTFSRVGSLLFLTVIGALLLTAPSGAYSVIITALLDISRQPEIIKSRLLEPLVLGQGFIILSVVSWIFLLLIICLPKTRSKRIFQARVFFVMFVLVSMALAQGTRAIGTILGFSLIL